MIVPILNSIAPPLLRHGTIKRNTLKEARAAADEIFTAVKGYGQWQWSEHNAPRKYAYRIDTRNGGEKVMVEEMP